MIIDFLSATYFQKNINSLAMDGRMVMLALMGGIKVEEFILTKILTRRLHIMGSTLRARSLEYKIQLTKDFSDFALPKFCLLYTSPSPRDATLSRMPSSA